MAAKLAAASTGPGQRDTAPSMQPASISLLTICGLDELESHGTRDVTHVLSILDPDWPEPQAFTGYGAHRRLSLRFNDIIDPLPGWVMPAPEHVSEILDFGRSLEGDAQDGGHLLVHCHAGISRSTAAMATLLAQAHPNEDADRIFSRLEEIRPIAWPNSVMIAYADEMLGRSGTLNEALRRLYGRYLAARPQAAEGLRRGGRGREIDMAIPPRGQS